MRGSATRLRCWLRVYGSWRHGWPRTATTAASRPRAMGWRARPRVYSGAAASNREGNWVIGARRCGWWRRQTRWWSIARASAPAARRPWTSWTRRRWWGTSGARSASCPRYAWWCRSTERCTCTVPHCQAITVGLFPRQAASRAQYGPRQRALAVYLVEQQFVPYGRVRELLADLFGASLSVGTLVTWVQQSATTLAPVAAQLTAALRQAPVLHHDETGVRPGGRRAWAHVASTRRRTPYTVHAKRGTDATDAMGILPDFTGVSVHDGWKPYRRYTRCRHALCNSHHLRELAFLEEQYHQVWAKQLKAVLREMKAAVEQARASGLHQLPATTRQAFVTRDP